LYASLLSSGFSLKECNMVGNCIHQMVKLDSSIDEENSTALDDSYDSET
jgi:hypothetical protein